VPKCPSVLGGWRMWELTQGILLLKCFNYLKEQIKRYKEKKEEVVEAEVDPERDQRMVFAYHISLKADERDVHDFFSRTGKAIQARTEEVNTSHSMFTFYISVYNRLEVVRHEKIVRLPSQIARFSKVGVELSLFIVP
ncbi:hypothetical protein LOK49_LG11G01029, partial [Camellia lanceoleosa]